MAKRWVVGGIWAILMATGLLTCGWYATAEHPRAMPHKVQKVTFLGAKHVKEAELCTITGVKAGMTLNPNLNRRGCQRIRDKYEEMGRTCSQCTLVKGGDLDDTEVVYQITEGPKVKVRDIQFTGNTFVSSARLATQMKSANEWFSLSGGTYNKTMAEAGKQELEKYYRRFGYQDVRVSLENQRSADGGSVTLIYHIHEGRRYRIQDVPDGTETKITPAEGPALWCSKPADYLDEDKSKADEKVIERPPSRVSQIFIMDDTRKKDIVVLRQGPLFASTIVKYAKIGKIRVTGNKRISTESILAHVPLVSGNILSFPDLQQAERNLAELGLFVVDEATCVRPTITVIDAEGESGRKDLLITVKEKMKGKGKKSETPR